ncbi:hypothetical protein [Streptomyces barringtoniae]|uniref:hypothetical protein n=1 Tax=Streptomyces barringtoniae TaxID=2892029 RepID=UPI001E4F9B1D|nr:hypothetical protein [Streptomyces barringtoniae]MCC5473706.1 hypothetical protein [Streptomyces barringtoniae]
MFVNAAELLRHSGYDGWVAHDIARCEESFRTVWYPAVSGYILYANGIWDLTDIHITLAIGVFWEEHTLFEDALRFAAAGAGNGSVLHRIVTDAGQGQESGRDQGHEQLAVGLMGDIAQVAWNQGDDLSSHDDRRFMKAAQYVAKYDTGQDVTYTTYTWGTGQNCAQQSQPVIGSGSRGQVRPVWAMLHFHYNRRLYLDDEYNSGMYRDLVAPEGGGGDYGSTSGGYDQLGFGTLRYAK